MAPSWNSKTRGPGSIFERVLKTVTPRKSSWSFSFPSSRSDLETNLNKTASKVPQSQSNHFAANFEGILEPIDRFEGLSPTGS